MSITAYLLDDFDVDPETKRVLGIALEKTRVSLGLADDFADGIIAKRLIELAKAGECNPDLLCQGAIEQLRGNLYGDWRPSARTSAAGEMADRSFLNDPKHWRDRAEEARTRADQLYDSQSKSAMLRIADDYELLAKRAEARAWGHSPKSGWVLFAAPRYDAIGTKRTYPRRLLFVRFRGEADVHGRVASPASAADDP
jgi:hypothetical protein